MSATSTTSSCSAYDKYGNAVGGQVLVDTERTNIDYSPAVAIGTDGNTVVTWSETQNASYLQNEPYLSTVYVRGFAAAPQPKALWADFSLPGSGGYSTISMDGQDNFTVAWDVQLRHRRRHQGHSGGGQTNVISEGVYGTEYQLDDYNTGTALAAAGGPAQYLPPQ